MSQLTLEQSAGLATDIIASFLNARTDVRPDDLPAIIADVHAAVVAMGTPPAPPEPPAPEPAVQIRSSVKPDYIVCLEDGKKLKMLKRYLRTQYNMTPEEYRAKWKLPQDYPMVAPNYATQRMELAKKIGLGRKPAAKGGK